MSMKVIDNDSMNTQEYVYRRLKARVIEFKHRPGEHLCIPSIAERLGVSPTPVREALQRLYKESLITMTPNRGFFSIVPSLKKMSDAFSTLNICLMGALSDPPSADVETHAPRFYGIRGEATCAASKVKIIEDALMMFAGWSRNNVLAEMIENLVMRTHAIRSLDLESEAVFEKQSSALTAITAHCYAGEVAQAKTVLAELHQGNHERLPLLITEAISRMCDC